MTEQDAVPIAQLYDTVDGRVFVPGDVGYDEARAVYLGGMDQRPAVIMQPADASAADDVVHRAPVPPGGRFTIAFLSDRST